MSTTNIALYEQFQDFYTVEREAQYSDPDFIYNQSTLYRSPFFELMMRESPAENLKGGDKIVEFPKLAHTNTDQDGRPTDTVNYPMPANLARLEIPHRLRYTPLVSNDIANDIQGGGIQFAFKNLAKLLDMSFDQSYYEGSEARLFAQPNYSTMEALTTPANVKPQWYSLFCFITDDGLAPSTTNLPGIGVAGNVNWPTVEQLDPTLYNGNWKNQVTTFDNTSAATRTATLLGGLLGSYMSVHWKKFGSTAEWFQRTELNKMRIITNKAGIIAMADVINSKSLMLAPDGQLQRYGATIAWAGIPFDYVDALDTIDVGADTGNTELYRFRFINFNGLSLKTKAGHNRRFRQFPMQANTPWSIPMLEETLGNFCCVNRRELGILKPAA